MLPLLMQLLFHTGDSIPQQKPIIYWHSQQLNDSTVIYWEDTIWNYKTIKLKN